MSSRQRKSGNSKDNTRRQLNDKNCSILSHMLACLPFSKLAKCTLNSGQDKVNKSTILHLLQLLGQVTNMENLGDLLEGLEDFLLKEGIQVVGIIRIVEAKLVVTVEVLIPLKDEDILHMLQEECLLQVALEAAAVAAMEWALQIINKAGLMVLQAKGEAKT